MDEYADFKRGERLAASLLMGGQDLAEATVDAFLVSPQAAEELARAADGLWRKIWVESAALGWHYQTWMDESVAEPFDNGDLAARLLTAWQKLRHPEDAPE